MVRTVKAVRNKKGGRIDLHTSKTNKNIIKMDLRKLQKKGTKTPVLAYYQLCPL